MKTLLLLLVASFSLLAQDGPGICLVWCVPDCATCHTNTGQIVNWNGNNPVGPYQCDPCGPILGGLAQKPSKQNSLLTDKGYAAKVKWVGGLKRDAARDPRNFDHSPYVGKPLLELLKKQLDQKTCTATH